MVVKLGTVGFTLAPYKEMYPAVYELDYRFISVLRHNNEFDSSLMELREDHRILYGLVKPKI